MKQKIYKYTIDVNGMTEIFLPFGSKVLDFQYQGNDICMWAMVPTETSEFKTRRFRIVGTGWQDDFDSQIYWKTVQDPVDGFVWHIFEIIS